MSLTSLSSVSFNTIATCATTLCVFEYGFREWAIQYLAEDSKYGRAIFECFNFSQACLNAVCILSEYPKMSKIDLFFLYFTGKAICKLAKPTSKVYGCADIFNQGLRINAKISGLLVSRLAYLQAESRANKVTSVIKCVVLGVTLFNDARATCQYFNQPTTTDRPLITDFYQFLKGRVPFRNLY